MKLKICEVCQQAQYLTKEKIEEGVCKRAIKKYAYVLHDKDTYTKEDEEKEPTHKEGMLLRISQYDIQLTLLPVTE